MAVNDNVGEGKGQFPFEGQLVSALNTMKQMALVLGRHRSHYALPDEINAAFQVQVSLYV